MKTAKAGDIVVGTILRNNDPRVPADRRDVRVTRILTWSKDKAKARYITAAGRVSHVSFHRIFMDGLPRHQGYNVIPLSEVMPKTELI